MMNNKKSGFTLIEVLIVVAIIGLLASVVLVGLGSFRTRGRDTRRVADLHEVQKGVELYYAKNNAYPNVSSWDQLQQELTGPSAGLGIARISDDPLAPARHYFYGAGNAAGAGPQSYVLGADLEDPNNPALSDASGDVDADTFNVNCSRATVYCLQF